MTQFQILNYPHHKTYGWSLEGDEWVPVMTNQMPTPGSVLQFIRCDSLKTRFDTGRCTCRKAELTCTDLCGCCDIGETCSNAEQLNIAANEEDEEDDQEDEVSM